MPPPREALSGHGPGDLPGTGAARTAGPGGGGALRRAASRSMSRARGVSIDREPTGVLRQGSSICGSGCLEADAYCLYAGPFCLSSCLAFGV